MDNKEDANMPSEVLLSKTEALYEVIRAIERDLLVLEDGVDKNLFRFLAALSECNIIIEVLSHLSEPAKEFIWLNDFKRLVGQMAEKASKVEYFGVEPHPEPALSSLATNPVYYYPDFDDRFSDNIPGLINTQLMFFDPSFKDLFSQNEPDDKPLSESDIHLLAPIKSFLVETPEEKETLMKRIIDNSNK